MSNSEYGIIPKQSKFSVRKLLVVPHKKGDLTFSYPAFGPNTYEKNLEDIEKIYVSPQTGKVRLRPANTSESISAVHSDFKRFKPEMLDLSLFQVGYIVRTQDGVFTNTNETNDSELKQLLNEAEKVNGIYLINDNIAFAPYDSFETGPQDVRNFAQGGLARGLEHTTEKVAKQLREIGSKFYKDGIDVWGFDIPKSPVLRIATLNSGFGRLFVDGYSWNDRDHGYAFGVLDNL